MSSFIDGADGNTRSVHSKLPDAIAPTQGSDQIQAPIQTSPGPSQQP